MKRKGEVTNQDTYHVQFTGIRFASGGFNRWTGGWLSKHLIDELNIILFISQILATEQTLYVVQDTFFFIIKIETQVE